MGLLITIAAFAVLLLLTLLGKKPLLVSAAITLLFTIVMGSLLSVHTPADVVRDGLHGVLTSLEITVLIFGALAFYHYLREGDFLTKLQGSAVQFSGNKLVVTILIVLFFGGFLEGISGFGIPAMIIAPLLLALGFPPYLAAALPLLANTVPVVFGAVGTPVKIGFADLPVENVPFDAALLLLLPLMVIPFMLKKMLLQSQLLSSGPTGSKTGWVAFSAGAAFALPFIFFSFLGPEFPTLLAALTGCLLWLLLLKKIKLPGTAVEATTLKQFFHTFWPYLFIALLLLAGKLVLQNARFVVAWPVVQLQKSIAFFQPGLFFLAGIFALHYFSKQSHPVSLRTVFRQTFSKLPVVMGTIACLAILARLLSQHLSITELMSEATRLPPFVFYIAAIFTGVLGSFMTGSATLSNMLFGTQWYQIALQSQIPLAPLLACQLTGAAIGNAISLQNIVMVQAVLDGKNLDKVVLKKMAKAVALLLLLMSSMVILLDRLGLWHK